MVSAVERPARRGFFARVWGLLTRTEEEWEIIDVERASVAGLFLGYACLLAAIKPLALVPQNLLMIHWPLGVAVEITAMRYLAALIEAFLIGWLINTMAPTYQGEKNLVQAMKLSVYSHTPGWVAGLIFIIPVPGFLGTIAEAYGLYILALGLARLMKSSKDEALGYFVGVAFSSIVLSVVLNAVIALISIRLLQGAPLDASAAYGG